MWDLVVGLELIQVCCQQVVVAFFLRNPVKQKVGIKNVLDKQQKSNLPCNKLSINHLWRDCHRSRIQSGTQVASDLIHVPLLSSLLLLLILLSTLFQNYLLLLVQMMQCFCSHSEYVVVVVVSVAKTLILIIRI